jgi:very-short-patch-repair endonuclease
VLVAGRGVVAGYSAAELLGASSAPPGAPAEVLLTTPRCQSYRCAGLVVHRDRSGPGETWRIDGTAVTTPERTAYDLARWAPTLTERVVAVDALVQHRRIDLADVRVLRHRHLGARGGAEVADVLALVDGRAESPVEQGDEIGACSRTGLRRATPPISSLWQRARMALVLGGLPAPAVQHPVIVRGRRYHLDLAYPHRRIAIEYDGEDHRRQARARRDLEREAALTSAGWRVLRFDAHVVLFSPARIVAEVRAVLAG